MRNLCYLRHLPEDEPYILEEYAEIVSSIEHERSLVGAGFFGPLLTVVHTPSLLYRLALGISLFAWQNVTGINAINYYS